MVIVGLGVAALMVLLGSGTKVNAFGNDLATAVFLAQELQAMTDQLTFEELVLDYEGTSRTFNAIDGSGTPLAALQHYQQRLDVWAVNPADLLPYTGTNVQALLLRATVLRGNDEVMRISWLRTG